MRDFGDYRAMLVDFGVDPRAIDTMCLAEITSTLKALERRRNSANGKGRKVSDEEWQQAQDMLASVAQHDPKVRLH